MKEGSVIAAEKKSNTNFDLGVQPLVPCSSQAKKGTGRHRRLPIARRRGHLRGSANRCNEGNKNEASSSSNRKREAAQQENGGEELRRQKILELACHRDRREQEVESREVATTVIEGGKN
uniref:Uncharacterized protein n=1 Tax=Lactuca sativa TaxID=4236 RepID=A0A9R1V4M4_LACSA|nr:hypothetical protein LSAT_V11C600320310 [Lactuca sativa]